jgi:WD40 repeat protein
MALAVSTDAKRAAVSRMTRSSDVLICDVDTGEILRQIECATPIRGLAFLKSGGLAVASTGGEIRIWDLQASDEGQVLFGDPAWTFWCLAASPDGRWLAAGTPIGTIAIWDFETRELFTVDTSLGGTIQSLAVSADSKLLATAGPRNVATVWNMRDQHQRARLTGHAQDVTAATFSPDIKSLATGSKDGTVILWDVATWEPKLTLTTGRTPVQSLAFSTDGQALFAGKLDGRVYVWRGASAGP